MSTATISKAEQRELDRHSALRDAFTKAVAEVAGNEDAGKDGALKANRDKLGVQLHTAADKLRKRGYTLAEDADQPTKAEPDPEPEPEPDSRLAELVGKGRVRITFSDRKMAVPGRVIEKDDRIMLQTNWGMDLPLGGLAVTAIEVKDPDSGRFVTA